jgi:xanthine dehydrogenase accessory factor
MLDRAELAAAVAAHGAVVRVVIAAHQGSSPREAGASMLVWDGGQSGTIGGGALEWQAAATARAMTGAAQVVRLPLGPALGQCCGGAVTLVSERIDAGVLAGIPESGLWARRIEGGAEMPLAVARALREARGQGVAGLVWKGGWLAEPVGRAVRPLWVWGAGHVGRALVAVLAPLPDLALTWVDTDLSRFPATIPAGVTALPHPDPAALVALAPAAAGHLILTYSHALDLALCDALLRHGFAACGLIGSASKWARFRSRLAALGHAPDTINRIRCPIGDPALGKHPQQIAISVAADLLRAPATLSHRARA